MTKILEDADKDLNQLFKTWFNNVKENIFIIHKRQETAAEK